MISNCGWCTCISIVCLVVAGKVVNETESINENDKIKNNANNYSNTKYINSGGPRSLHDKLWL